MAMAEVFERTPVATAKTQRGKTAYLSGLAAEDQVIRLYQNKGLTLSDARWRGSRGEVDLIFEANGLVVFVEVKKSRSFGESASRVSRPQRARILTAAKEYLSHRGLSMMTDMQFDVALMKFDGDIKIIENAFGDF